MKDEMALSRMLATDKSTSLAVRIGTDMYGKSSGQRNGREADSAAGRASASHASNSAKVQSSEARLR